MYIHIIIKKQLNVGEYIIHGWYGICKIYNLPICRKHHPVNPNPSTHPENLIRELPSSCCLVFQAYDLSKTWWLWYLGTLKTKRSISIQGGPLVVIKGGYGEPIDCLINCFHWGYFIPIRWSYFTLPITGVGANLVAGAIRKED